MYFSISKNRKGNTVIHALHINSTGKHNFFHIYSFWAKNDIEPCDISTRATFCVLKKIIRSECMAMNVCMGGTVMALLCFACDDLSFNFDNNPFFFFLFPA